MLSLAASIIIGIVSVGLLAYSIAPYYFGRLFARIKSPVPLADLIKFQVEFDALCIQHKLQKRVLKFNLDYRPSTIIVFPPNLMISPALFSEYSESERKFLLVRTQIRIDRLIKPFFRNHFRIWTTYFGLVGFYVTISLGNPSKFLNLAFGFGLLIQIVPLFLVGAGQPLDDDLRDDENKTIAITQDKDAAISAIQKEFAEIAKLEQPHLRMASTKHLNERIDLLRAFEN